MPTLSIVRQEHAEEPVLFVRSRVARHELATAIGEGLGKTFPYALKSGHAIAGRPFTRYLSTGPGLYTIEVGMPLAAPVHGDGEIEAGVLPGGPVAVAVHAGPYDQLSETYSALERWIEANGYRASDAPWESHRSRRSSGFRRLADRSVLADRGIANWGTGIGPSSSDAERP